MEQQGRGKSRGRTRGPATSSAEPSTSAWSRRPGPAAQPGPSQLPYARPGQPTQVAGRGLQRIGETREVAPSYSRESGMEPMDVTSAGGSGDAPALGRGAMRGRRVISGELLVTKPANLPTKKGTTGQQVRLQANYFKLPSTTNWTLYQYRVDFAPEEDRTLVRKGLLRLHKEKLGAYIFDGTVLYTSHRLPDQLQLLSTRSSDDAKITINIKFIGDMAKGDHHYLQFFNIIMRKCLEHLKLQLVGRDFYDARSKIEVAEYKLELWPGYFTSIRQHEHDILMCSEITHKVMRQETLLDIWRNCRETGRDAQKMYAEQVIGAVVLTDYNNNTYRVNDVDFKVTPNDTFTLKTGEKITYKDYYKNRYQIRISENSQPMLVAETKQKDRRMAGQAERLVYLVPELCRSTGLTDNMRENFHLMQALAKFTRVSPQSRIEKLMQFNRRLRSETKVVQELKEWDLQLDDRLVELPGRILPIERILFRSNGVSAGPEADWTREFRHNQVIMCKPLKDWVLICMQRVRREVEEFLKNLNKAASGMGFAIDYPRVIAIADDRSGTYAETLERIMSKSYPQLVFCVVSNNRSERYSTIKKKCCIDRPVPSQVLLQRNLTKGLSVATKVAIQLNCKLGGAPWCVEIPLSGLMVVGFDVCHDTNVKGRDFGAMVATLDRNLTRYYSAVSHHSTGEELSHDFSVNLCKALQVYRDCNENKLPERILIYRDGVGEGQIPFVYNHEVGEIRAKLTQMYGTGAQPKLAFVIVTKRVNTRIFYKGNNPPCGTVVDDVITNPVKYDFFIVSQHVRQGTVTPTSYSVISDNIGLDADKLQRLTYKLTHMYFNWSGTVRVPAPCQYAHKLAFLVGQYIHRSPSTQLENLLYYL
ncbi:hypothetical protein KPH14_009684 [Odynerus spinipes]|uniref:Piwi n=1 Tax=Odynerus spinipes TaxID=1348599 RepID=A0AAD9RR00_9HYME|nr:hypothetical protein KPH14_009684 [Odynerus spinipes]